MMQEKPVVKTFEDGSTIWSHTFEQFQVKVYKPTTDLPEEVINYGLISPYLLVLEEQQLTEEGAKEYAKVSGLERIASRHASTVVFLYPTCEGGWEKADKELFVELIANTKIHQYFESGYAILNNFFTKKCDGYAIRGALFKTVLWGCGKSADYIGQHLLKTIDGEGLWGPADITPTVCVLENINVMPQIERPDIPIVSIGNSETLNATLQEKVDELLVVDDEFLKAVTENQTLYEKVYKDFIYQYKRWGWDGDLMLEPDFEALGMVSETGIFTVKTSEDNKGDDQGTIEHKIGFISYYNKDLFEKGPAPLLLCFHGGGDSAMHIAHVSEWYQVAHDHDFLLVCIENHLNSTATEMMEFLDLLKEKYSIDETAIYGSGFSMGGCKSWDLYQEYPEVFAGLAPMDATFDAGCNFYGDKVTKPLNDDVLVPIFYAGGELTPLPELPFQAQKCIDRMQYVLHVNDIPKKYDVNLDEVDSWENSIWGIDGDRMEQVYDPERDSYLTLQYFDSENGNCYTVFGSVSDQGHECRYHTCEQAWCFLSQFRRVEGYIEKITLS